MPAAVAKMLKEYKRFDLRKCTAIKVVRFDLYPSNNPKYQVVAFDVRCTINDRRKYVETRIDIEDAKHMDETEVTTLAWKRVKDEVVKWFDEHATSNPMVGSSFEIPEDEPEKREEVKQKEETDTVQKDDEEAKQEEETDTVQKDDEEAKQQDDTK